MRALVSYFIFVHRDPLDSLGTRIRSLCSSTPPTTLVNQITVTAELLTKKKVMKNLYFPVAKQAAISDFMAALFVSAACVEKGSGVLEGVAKSRIARSNRALPQVRDHRLKRCRQ